MIETKISISCTVSFRTLWKIFNRVLYLTKAWSLVSNNDENERVDGKNSESFLISTLFRTVCRILKIAFYGVKLTKYFAMLLWSKLRLKTSFFILWQLTALLLPTYAETYWVQKGITVGYCSKNRKREKYMIWKYGDILGVQ